jgi:16S rRNA (uracil1498-N3)-methyltransferase
MTRTRWIADEASGNRAALIGEHADHLVRVLRARVGQEFDIAAGDVVRRGRIVTIAGDRVEFELGEELPPAVAPDLTLLLSIFKFDRMEWAIEKCVELGVSRIVPVIARRTDAHLATAAGKRVERWRRIALQAAEQSRRALPTEIADPIALREAAKLPGALRIVLSESEQHARLRDALAAESPGAILLAVGPEGGWAEDELKMFQESGWTSVSLGTTILRAETAAIAAVAIAVSELSQ